MTVTLPGVSSTHAVAHEAVSNGLSIVPVRADGSKAPAGGSWKKYQQRKPTLAELDSWFTGGSPLGVGLVTGYDGVEMTEVESAAADKLQGLQDLAEATGLGEIFRKACGWVERSPSGGFHFIYRITAGQVAGNTKLARDAAGNVLAETRGLGGMCILAPSAGSVHPNGKPWERTAGGPDTMGHLSPDEAAAFRDLFRTLGQTPVSEQQQQQQQPSPFAAGNGSQPHQAGGGLTPGDDYEARTDWQAILGPAGWKQLYTDAAGVRYWTRPGKSTGISATTGKDPERDRLYVFTSSTDLPQERSLTKFSAYAHLHHNGDHSAAASQLRKDGYGEQRTRPAQAGKPAGTDAADTDGAAPTAGKGDKRTAAEVLAGLALAGYDLGISDKGEPFALPKTGPRIVRMLRGGNGSLRAELSKQYYNSHGKVAGQQALTDALMVLEGIAQDAEPSTLHQRVAEADGAIWYDLGSLTGAAVRIAGGTWETVQRPPVLFRRTELTSAAPEPIRGGQIEELFSIANVNALDRPLLLAFLVSVFYENIPHPVMAIAGEQGSAKSTNARILTDLTDPSPVPLRKIARDVESWVTAASGSWVATIDNVSTIQDWFSDALCRASTGDGDVRRKLYTDGGLAVTSFRRCVILTGIDLGGLRGDLTERLLKIDLDRIPAGKRQEERAVLGRWQEAHPRILGALLDLVARVQAVLPGINLDKKSRMADFHNIVAAVDQVLGTDGQARYLAQAENLAQDSLAADPFITAVMHRIHVFDGTAGQLLDQVRPDITQGWSGKGWPRNARRVTELLMRNAPALRSSGWEVDHTTNRKGTTHWALRAPVKSVQTDGEPPESGFFTAGQLPVSLTGTNRH